MTGRPRSSPGPAAPALPSSLARVRRVRVGTTNGAKLDGARAALAAYLNGIEVAGVAVASGVPEQPVGFEEIVSGARNRARAALASGECELAVGIEDGLVELGIDGAPVLNVGCAIVSDGHTEGLGLSAGFVYPPSCAERALRERLPIGALFDAMWLRWRGARHPELAGRALGNIGKLTLGVLPRSEYARQAVLCALVRLLHPDLYRQRANERELGAS